MRGWRDTGYCAGEAGESAEQRGAAA